MLGMSGWFSSNILGNRDGEVLEDPESFKSKEVSKLGVLDFILQPELYPDLYGNLYHKVRIHITRRGVTTKRAGTTSTSSGGSATPWRSRSTSCAGQHPGCPLVLDLSLFMDLAARSGMKRDPGVAVFYFKSPMVAQGLYPGTRPVHPTQEAERTTLRHMRGKN